MGIREDSILVSSIGSNRIILPEQLEKDIRNGADINGSDPDGFTVLMACCKKNSIPLVECAIKHGVRINDENLEGWTALHYACYCKLPSSKIIGDLVEAGADVNRQNAQGETPLMYLSNKNCPKLVRFLLDNGADPNIQEIEESVALHYACRAGDIKTVKILISAGADRNIEDCNANLPVDVTESKSIIGFLESFESKTVLEKQLSEIEWEEVYVL